MCSAPKPPAPPPPPAAAVPLPAETSKAPTVDIAPEKLRRNGRSKLTIPSAGGASTSGMSGLNIPT